MIKEIKVIDDFLNKSIRQDILNNTLIQFKRNLYSSDIVCSTKSIIDCHGLALSKSKYFPYEVNCWNIFCLKVKEQVVNYCEKYGYDSFDIIPYSCFSERVDDDPSTTTLNQKILDYDDEYISKTSHSPQTLFDESGQVNKHMIRTVYNLVNPMPKYGTILYGEKKEVIPISGIENRLLIFDGNTLHTNVYPIASVNLPLTDAKFELKKYCIVFDWYINHPFDVPDWILP